MLTVILALLLIYIVIQAIYSTYFFRRASHLSKTKFTSSAEFGSKNSPELKLTVYGDSVAVGVGASSFETSLSGRLANYLAKENYVIFNNEAISGLKMAGVLTSPKPYDRQDLILIVVSSNDLFRFTNLTEFSKSTKKTIEKFSPLGKKVIIVGPGRLFDASAVPIPLRLVYKIKARTYSDVISTEAAKFDNVVHISPVNPPINLEKFKGAPGPDRFHPSDDGYESWFEMVKTAL